MYLVLWYANACVILVLREIEEAALSVDMCRRSREKRGLFRFVRVSGLLFMVDFLVVLKGNGFLGVQEISQLFSQINTKETPKGEGTATWKRTAPVKIECAKIQPCLPKRRAKARIVARRR